MKKVIVKNDYFINKEFYEKGKEVNNLTYEEIVKLNEKGVIEPLSLKDLIQIKNELEKKEEKDGTII